MDKIDHRLSFQRLLTEYQKNERKRAEDCIAGVIDDLCDLTQTPEETNQKITERLVKHFHERR